MRWFVVFLLVLGDQATKQLVLAAGGDVAINQGALAGVVPGFFFFDVVAVVVAFWAAYKGKSYGWWLILGGGMANVFDRIARGGVVDIFFVFGWWFNVADIAITLGLLSLVLVQLGHGKNSSTVSHS